MSAVRGGCLALSLMLLTGCSPRMNGEYYVESAHVEQKTEEVDTTDLKAATYAQLKNALMQLVRAGETEGDIRLDGYSGGDVERDLLSAIGEVSNEDPLGKYAVYVMAYKLTTVLSSSHANISVLYRRTAAQVATIRRTSGRAGLLEELSQAMGRYQHELVLEMAYFDPVDYDPAALARTVYLDNPLHALGFPEMTVTLYPDSGLQRIIEIEFAYPRAAQDAQTMERQLDARAREIAEESAGGDGEARTLLRLYDALRAQVSNDAPGKDAEKDADAGLSLTPYGALVRGKAAGEGYALALKLLCDLSGIPCAVVPGQRSNAEHAWNVVQLGGDWYHVDAAADDAEGGYGRFLKTDADMEDSYRWAAGVTPACTSSAITAESLLGTEPSPSGGETTQPTDADALPEADKLGGQ